MHKIWLIIKREYSSRVKKKSFLLLTILVPVIIIGFYSVIIAIAIQGASGTETVAVIDKANLFEGKTYPEKGLDLKFIPNETEEGFKAKYQDQGYKYFLSVPEMDIKSPVSPNLYYAKSLGPGTQAKIEAVINGAIEKKRMLAENIDINRLNSIKSNISVVQTELLLVTIVVANIQSLHIELLNH